MSSEGIETIAIFATIFYVGFCSLYVYLFIDTIILTDSFSSKSRHSRSCFRGLEGDEFYDCTSFWVHNHESIYYGSGHYNNNNFSTPNNPTIFSDSEFAVQLFRRASHLEAAFVFWFIYFIVITIRKIMLMIKRINLRFLILILFEIIFFHLGSYYLLMGVGMIMESIEFSEGDLGYIIMDFEESLLKDLYNWVVTFIILTIFNIAASTTGIYILYKIYDDWDNEKYEIIGIIVQTFNNFVLFILLIGGGVMFSEGRDVGEVHNVLAYFIGPIAIVEIIFLLILAICISKE